MQSFFHGIVSIFFDISPLVDMSKSPFSPQDLTEHYQMELADFSMDGVYIAAHYKDIQDTIEAYKYRSDRQYIWIYVDILANIGDTYWVFQDKSQSSIIGVPMHWSRYTIRWFNHIDILASRLSKKIWIPKIEPIQAHFTRRQSKLTKQDRMKNREYAFRLKPWQVLPKTIILIDDIISTGSTANACAKILKSAWVEQVYGIFLASNQ
jgi:ComF family protein